MRSNGSPNSAQNSASIQNTAVRISSCSSGRRSSFWIARRTGVTARLGAARRGTKSGGRLIAQARAPGLRTARRSGRSPRADSRDPGRRPPWTRRSRSTVSRLMQLENQVVGPQAGHVRGGIPAFERIIEIVGQENRLQPGGLPDLRDPTPRRRDRAAHGRKARRSVWGSIRSCVKP